MRRRGYKSRCFFYSPRKPINVNHSTLLRDRYRVLDWVRRHYMSRILGSEAEPLGLLRENLGDTQLLGRLGERSILCVCVCVGWLTALPPPPPKPPPSCTARVQLLPPLHSATLSFSFGSLLHIPHHFSGPFSLCCACPVVCLARQRDQTILQSVNCRRSSAEKRRRPLLASPTFRNSCLFI